MFVSNNHVCGETLQILRHPRRQVSISRDSKDFVVAFQPDNLVVFRHEKASELRKVCASLRWQIVSDTVAEANDPASW
jgi:hypothetical protein